MPLSRRKLDAHKNLFGHVLVLAGSRRMLGAAALTGLAAMRSGAGLTTLGVPASLNAVLQKKISPVLMTLPLKETSAQTLASTAFPKLRDNIKSFNVLAMGPGVTTHPSTGKLLKKILAHLQIPLILDADALNLLAEDCSFLTRYPGERILTPHPGEMARLTGTKKASIEKNRGKVAEDFARAYNCILLLKGHQTIVASPQGKIYTNRTGNPGMATAGSGDVLTGMISALWAQGLPAFEAACWGAYLHGLAGDLAARAKTPIAMIATDIIDQLPFAIQKKQKSPFHRQTRKKKSE